MGSSLSRLVVVCCSGRQQQQRSDPELVGYAAAPPSAYRASTQSCRAAAELQSCVVGVRDQQARRENAMLLLCHFSVLC